MKRELEELWLLIICSIDTGISLISNNMKCIKIWKTCLSAVTLFNKFSLTFQI